MTTDTTILAAATPDTLLRIRVIETVERTVEITAGALVAMMEPPMRVDQLAQLWDEPYGVLENALADTYNTMATVEEQVTDREWELLQ